MFPIIFDMFACWSVWQSHSVQSSFHQSQCAKQLLKRSESFWLQQIKPELCNTCCVSHLIEDRQFDNESVLCCKMPSLNKLKFMKLCKTRFLDVLLVHPSAFLGHQRLASLVAKPSNASWVLLALLSPKMSFWGCEVSEGCSQCNATPAASFLRGNLTGQAPCSFWMLLE